MGNNPKQLPKTANNTTALKSLGVLSFRDRNCASTYTVGGFTVDYLVWLDTSGKQTYIYGQNLIFESV